MKDFIIELDNTKIDNMSGEDIKAHIDEKLWNIASDLIKLDDKTYKQTNKLEESEIYIYSPGWIYRNKLTPDMVERLEKARKLNKKIVKIEIIDMDKMPDKTIMKIRATEE